jgi:type IV pilus assembly protein PilW
MINNKLMRPLSTPWANKQSGMSLIEVMVAMTIGLIILVALGYFFLGSTQINRTTDDVSRMQESGRNALELMGRSIRQAGYRIKIDEAFGGNNPPDPNNPPKPVTGTDNTSTPDAITILYNAQEGGDVDCTGADVLANTGGKPSMVTATFDIVGGRLRCNGTDVVDNIEDMQISYVIDTGENFLKDGNAESIKTNPTTDEFKQVAAVQVTLLTKGPTANVATNKSQTLTYNGTSNTYTDGFLRQVYSATFNVRNQSW